MDILFRKNKELEAQIDEYLDLLIRGGLIFKQGIKLYLEERYDEFEEQLRELRRIEDKGDELRRHIETKLYLKTLIPEARGDVLGLLESADQVLNIITANLLEFSVEIPEVPAEMHPVFSDLAKFAIDTSDGMVKAIRAYFRDLAAVRDNINQVFFYRKETNKIAEKFKRFVFRQDLRLSHKIHLRYFAYHIEQIAEESEDVCDRLAIATIKRYL